MDNVTLIINSAAWRADALRAALPAAVWLDDRPELPVADGQAGLVLAAVPDADAVPRVSELLRPIAVGGCLVLFGPADVLEAAAEVLPEAKPEADGELSDSARGLLNSARELLDSVRGELDPGLALQEQAASSWRSLVLRRDGLQHTGSAGCIICGRANASGLGWRYWQSGERAWASGAIPAHLQGFDGIVHGGIVAAMLDDALWYAINAATGQVTLTAELTTRYRLPAPIGETLTAAARFTGSQRRILTAEARLWGPDGKVLATASGRFLPGGDDLAGRLE